ncbi:tol-pal system protein YbgF [Parathalassolituus penaei]|uniref:Tol-pal system protein YbgF n=1 Tax=Parathalassolituus penaei TaxID=2997323 RepID=A0A9X3E9X7_9GAMM|nr:tol-pal system protein YbgF [Parathalassolituus penaei]MCY0963627.1 tol-pal system protein YbgF [Parathalassolituus penaei]
MSELLMQIDQMQQEIAQLRGTVESQSMKIKRLEKDSETRYLDLDRRIVFLTTANGSGASATTPSASSTATTDTSASSSASTSVSSTASDSSAASSEPTSSASAEDAYNAAMALVKDKQFAAANKAFEQFVKTYPNDALTANAYYWNGEVYMVRQELASAITSFRKVIDKYPDHVKAPDATYKYAVALDKSGDKAGAIEWLKTVVKRYSGKADGTVRLAQSYLDKLNAGG